MIRAKFKCISVTHYENDSEGVELRAANGRADTANAQWCKMTPNGALNLTINNPAALGKFQPGKWYFLDFTETTEEAI